MGVRGLTSYIAQHADLYLKPYELHDCDLVIDGDNLACNLYKDVSGCNSAFGGDYDEYYRTVVAFFHLLFECNIRPFVLLDGGYERKKMKTVEQRLRSKIGIVKRLNPSYSKPIFPLMMREVFVDAAQDCGVKIMRCIFEADNELAILGRKLNCPVLSYDSDFYIHNVKYIPLVTLTMKVLTKKVKSSDDRTQLRQCEVKNLIKRKKMNKGVKLQEQESCVLVVNSKETKTIKYLDCCIYKIKYLTYGCKIEKDMLPIFAALLGNDYIEASVFRQFYIQVCLKGTNKKASKKQRRIVAILRWLQHETKESALNKILIRMKKEYRESLLWQIESATCGYNQEKSEAFNYFGLDEIENDLSETSDEQETTDSEEELVEDAEDNCEDNIDEDETTEEEVEDKVELEQTDVESEDVKITTNTSEIDLVECADNMKSDNDNSIIKHNFPEWFLERIYAAQLPRFCIDLMHQNLYINNPQIENFLFSDCNKVALPILYQIFSLIHYPEKRELRYLTRVIRVTNVHYKKLTPVEYNSEFDPAIINLNAMKDVFRRLNLCTDELFNAVNILPGHIRLYMLALVYWSSQAQHSDIIHFHSILMCLVILNTVDSKVIPIRDEKLFYKRYHKIIQKTRVGRAVLQEAETKNVGKYTREELKAEKTRELLKNLKPHEKIKFISKAECLLVQENVLKYFKLPQLFGKHHNEFSSSTMHGFSEFQAVIFQLYTLNVLVNCPFESARMGQMYSGMFLYNLYTTLSCRVDIQYYIQNYILGDSPIMFEYYQFLLDWCKPFVKFLKESKHKNTSKKFKKKNHKLIAEKNSNDFEELESGSDHEFNDLNNKFCTLLKVDS